MASLLLLACSRRKQAVPHLLPALERYQGPQFQVVRKFLLAHPEMKTKLDIAILSARLGIISSTEPILDYDQRMTPEQATSLQPIALASLRQYFQHTAYQRCCISLGKDYLSAIVGVEDLVPSGCEITYTRGSQGERLSQLFDWLYHNQPTPIVKPARVTKSVHIRGIEIRLSPEEVIALGRSKLASPTSSLPKAKTWYVDIDGQRVPPKWLISQITELPVSAFNTTDARFVLESLGIKVNRIQGIL